MAFVNMFDDRVEQFNLREENERLAELFSDEKLQEEAQWQAYSVKEISRLFSISEEEALETDELRLIQNIPSRQRIQSFKEKR